MQWAVIYIFGEYRLVEVSRDRKRVYWNGGPGYCRLEEGKLTIVHDYGNIDPDDNEKIDDVFLDFYKNYNQPIEKIIISSGWLSPDGKFFPCGYYEHANTAEKLCAIYYDLLTNPIRILEENNWIKVYIDGEIGVEDFMSFIPTDNQIDTIVKLIECSTADLDNSTPDYVNNLKDTLKYWRNK